VDQIPQVNTHTHTHTHTLRMSEGSGHPAGVKGGKSERLNTRHAQRRQCTPHQRTSREHESCDVAVQCISLQPLFCLESRRDLPADHVSQYEQTVVGMRASPVEPFCTRSPTHHHTDAHARTFANLAAGPARLPRRDLSHRQSYRIAEIEWVGL
jgi:hypothetical protein